MNVQKCFSQFKSSDFVLEDEDHPGRLTKFEDEELEGLLNEDYCQTQVELTESLGVLQAAILKRLKLTANISKSKEDIGCHMN